MLIKFTNPHIRFRNISEEDFTSIGFDGQPGIRIDANVMPFIDLPEPVAQWLLDNEPADWARAEKPTLEVVGDADSEGDVASDSADEGKSKKK